MHKHLLLFLTLGAAAVLNAQTPPSPMVIPLWPNGAPGAIANPAYVETAINHDDPQKMPFTIKVTDPRLELYRPAPEKATGSAVIVCPGGGYAILADQHEGKDIAHWLTERGVTAFVLKYRLPSDEIMKDKSVGPLQDAQAAIRLVRTRAAEWSLDPKRIAIMGFSAGGHLAASATTLFDDPVYAADSAVSARPDLSILIYPVISMRADITHRGSRENLLGKSPDDAQVDHFTTYLQVTPETPPTFLVHSADDGAVPLENSLRFAQALKENKISCELHVFPHGGHGYGLAVGHDGTHRQWPSLLENWLRSQGW